MINKELKQTQIAQSAIFTTGSMRASKILPSFFLILTIFFTDFYFDYSKNLKIYFQLLFQPLTEIPNMVVETSNRITFFFSSQNQLFIEIDNLNDEIEKLNFEILKLKNIEEENITIVENDNLQEDATEELILTDEAEINLIIKDEIFTDDQSEGDLVVETIVAALAKDDGGITAQMLGKSFLSSGNDIRPDLDLPEGMSLNSEEANTFIEEKAMQEIEKVMLVSARVKNVEYVPTKFNQLSGFDDIRVPILNDETGDVVFLDMGNIDFKPQVLPANFNQDQPQLLPRIPEQLFLKGGDENVFIDFDEGQFVETVFDPEIEILDQKYQAAVNAGATQDEIEEIFIEMDEIMQKADESMAVSYTHLRAHET